MFCLNTGALYLGLILTRDKSTLLLFERGWIRTFGYDLGMTFGWIQLRNILWTSNSLFIDNLSITNIAIELDFFAGLLVCNYYYKFDIYLQDWRTLAWFDSAQYLGNNSCD